MEDARKTGTQEISSDGAFLIFDKWHSEDSPVQCLGTLFGCGLALKGKVLAASREEVSFGVKDKSVITLRLDVSGLAFLYGETKDAPIDVPDEAKGLSGLVVGLPFRVTVETALAARRGEVTEAPPREKLVFIELPR